MDSSIYLMLFLIIFLILYLQYENKKVLLKQFIKSKNTQERFKMLELAKRFMEKRCIIYTFNSQITGIIKEVTNGAILVEQSGVLEAVNLDFIVRIREYPQKQKKKEKIANI